MAANLDVKQLEELAGAGEIDTVLCMFTDLQGRFIGKRVLPHFFLEDVLGGQHRRHRLGDAALLRAGMTRRARAARAGVGPNSRS